MPVHSTTGVDKPPVFVAAKRFHRGDVIAVFDPNWPMPKWLPNAILGLETVTNNSHDNCVIKPVLKPIREACNTYMTSRSLGPYLPCSKIDEVANSVLRVYSDLKWECKSEQSPDAIMLPHVLIVAKTDIFIGHKVILEHSKFVDVDGQAKQSPCQIHTAKPVKVVIYLKYPKM
jgi:hypothetical protein